MKQGVFEANARLLLTVELRIKRQRPELLGCKVEFSSLLAYLPWFRVPLQSPAPL